MHDDSGELELTDPAEVGPVRVGPVTVGDVTVGPGTVGRVLHSDPHDFAGLYIRHRSSFTLHARRYLNDVRDADEVVQEAFLRLFLALPELDTELQALAYCRRTITNLCIDRYRAQARRPRLVDLESVPADWLADEDDGDPVVRAEDAATVREALSLLSPLHREALVKREIEEKPLAVIAAELDIPEESVKHVLFRARRALRRRLAGTSLAPGQDGERPLGGLLAKGPAGLAALVMVLLLGLSTGPDLRTIPVAGAALPDLPSVTEIARAVGQALSGGDPGPVVAGGDAGGLLPGSAGSGEQDPGGVAGPLLSSPSPMPSVAPPEAAATATVGLLPSAVASPAPSPAPSSAPAAIPSPRPAVSPNPAALPSVEPSPRPARAPSPEPVPGASSPDASSGPSRRPSPPASSPSRSPSPRPTPSTQQSPDPASYNTPGLEYQLDPVTQQPVLVPVGATPFPGLYAH